MRRFLGLGGGGGGASQTVTATADRYPPSAISGNNAADPYRAEDVLTIKHGLNEYLFKYPVHTIGSHKLNVGHVRDKCSEITGVDVARLALICAGRQLKDDNATLQSIGVEHGAKILAMGTNAQPPSRPAESPPVQQQQQQQRRDLPKSPAAKIEAVRDDVLMLLPQVDEFIANSPPLEAAKRADLHRRLGETIMGELLKLDSVETEDPVVRAKRKEVVKEIQGTLDALDRALRGSV
jgi:hypothetical protein